MRIISSPEQRRIFAWAVLVLYSMVLMYWMFVGFGRAAHPGEPLQYNLIPLHTIRLYFDMSNGLSLLGRTVNLLGNVAVFIPFGILIPQLRRKRSSMRTLAYLTLPSILLLECLQMVLHVGSFDIDDLLLNLLGVWTGYFLFSLARKLGRNHD